MQSNILKKIEGWGTVIFCLFVLPIMLVGVLIAKFSELEQNTARLATLNLQTVFWYLVLVLILLVAIIARLGRLLVVIHIADEQYREIIDTLGGARALNAELAKRAKMLDEVFKNESEWLAVVAKSSFHEGKCNLEHIDDRVKRTKRHFWDFHALVKSIGVEVKDSYKNYLPGYKVEEAT